MATIAPTVCDDLVKEIRHCHAGNCAHYACIPLSERTELQRVSWPHWKEYHYCVTELHPDDKVYWCEYIEFDRYGCADEIVTKTEVSGDRLAAILTAGLAFVRSASRT